MNYERSETNDALTGLLTQGICIVTEPTERQHPLWLSSSEAEMLLTLCSLSPISAGDLEEELFHKIGRLIGSFETPHPKEL